MAHNRVVLD
jgi:hypothetical protein